MSENKKDWNIPLLTKILEDEYHVLQKKRERKVLDKGDEISYWETLD